MISRLKNGIAGILITVSATAGSYAVATSPPEQTIVTPGVDLRLFVGPPHLAGILEVEYRNELGNRQYRSFRAGVTGILVRGDDGLIKWGTSFSREYGVLLENDWQNSGGEWNWIPAYNRGLSSLSLDLTPRKKIGSNVMGELRVRYQHGIGDARRYLKFRPGLQWSIQKDGAPFLETFLQFEAYFNSTDKASNPNETWTYFSALWHAASGMLVGPKVAFRGSSLAGTADTGPWQVSNSTWSVGLVGIFVLR